MKDNFTLSLGGLHVAWDAPLDGRVLVRLEGDLDSLTVPVFQEVLDNLYRDKCFVVRLDLTQLDFIDSSGLGAIVGAWRRCREHDGTVTATGPTVPVRRLMDMTGISSFILAAA